MLLSCLLGVSTIAIAGSTYGSSCQQEHSNVQTAMWIDLALAASHIFFAVYIQWKLIKALAEPREEAYGGSQGMVMAKHMWRIVLYDVAFCFYVPLGAFSFVFGCFQPTWASECVHDGLAGGETAWFFGVLFALYGVLAISYLCCWSCVVTICGITQGSIQQARAAFVQPQGRDPLVPANPHQAMAPPMVAVAHPVLAQPPVSAAMPA